MTDLNKDLMKTSEVYRNVAALDCFSNEIQELENEINELKISFNSDSYLPDLFTDKEFYPWEHQPAEEIYQHTLEDVKSGFWGEPFIV